jgi:hypothetical protein
MEDATRKLCVAPQERHLIELGLVEYGRRYAATTELVETLLVGARYL